MKTGPRIANIPSLNINNLDPFRYKKKLVTQMQKYFIELLHKNMKKKFLIF